jgi:flagellar basal body-associated protein FliL
MEQLAEWAVQYEEEEFVEPFYQSPRLKAYSFQMQPIVANLKRRNKDRENPMGFFEFVVEGNSGDTVVELKLRESEFKDLVQRVIETHHYDDLENIEGMNDLKNDIKLALNAQLNEGLVTRIEIRNYFIKP